MSKSYSMLSRTLGTAILALSLSFTAQSAMAAPSSTQGTGTVGIAADTPITPQIIQWSPYDGAQITTAAKCQSRLNYLKSVRPDISHWACTPSYTAQCPPKKIWMVMVGYSNLRVAAPDEALTAPLSDASLARC
jgi:hypothetical protein